MNIHSPCEDSVDVVLLQLLLGGHLVEEVVEALLLLLLARRVEVLVLVDLGGRGLQLGDLPLVDRLGDEEVVHGQRPEGRQELRRDVVPYLGRVQRPDGLDHCGENGWWMINLSAQLEYLAKMTNLAGPKWLAC